MKAMVKPYII